MTTAMEQPGQPNDATSTSSPYPSGSGGEPKSQRPTAITSRRLHAIADFDLLNALGVGVARLAEVAPPDRGGAPNFDVDTLKASWAAVRQNPRVRKNFLVFMGIVGVFSAIIGWLLLSGTLWDFYHAVYTFFPGRPWTHVMRDHPWLYAIPAVVLAAVPFCLAPPNRWGRACLTYVIFLIGFLGGHVFW